LPARSRLARCVGECLLRVVLQTHLIFKLQVSSGRCLDGGPDEPVKIGGARLQAFQASRS
jgi:hypothetical protein